MYKILVVDDSESIRAVSVFTLENAGYEVIQAEDAFKGVEKLNEYNIDFIITDYNMPGATGVDFIKMARAISMYKFTPIIVLTTEFRDDLKKDAKIAGATGWLVKPFVPDKLIGIVKKLLK